MYNWEIECRKKDVTLNDLSFRCHISVANIYNWANGRSLPTLLTAIAFYQKVTDYLKWDVRFEDFWANGESVPVDEEPKKLEE